MVIYLHTVFEEDHISATRVTLFDGFLVFTTYQIANPFLASTTFCFTSLAQCDERNCLSPKRAQLLDANTHVNAHTALERGILQVCLNTTWCRTFHIHMITLVDTIGTFGTSHSVLWFCNMQEQDKKL